MRHAVKIVSVSALALSALSFATAVRSAEPHYVLPPQAVIQCAATDEAYACPPTPAVPSSAGPMIISYGPPPSAYSPSADFRTRLQTTPGWASYIDSCIAASAAAGALPPPPPLPPQSYPMYAPAYAPSGAAMSAVELPPPPGFEVCQPRQIAVEERFACRDGYAPIFSRPQSRSTTIAWSAPLCNCTAGNATCGAGCATECKAMSNTSCNTACSTACGHDCPCGAACQCGSTCDCAGNCTCSANTAKACSATCSTCTSQCSQESACGTADRIDHILEAVHHLEAAGMQADADALRRKCDQQMKSVVERLKQAEAEVAALKSAAAERPAQVPQSVAAVTTKEVEDCPAEDHKSMVSVKVELLEVSHTKCRNLGLDIAEIPSEPSVFGGIAQKAFASGNPSGIDAAFAGLIDTLKKDGAARVLAAPQIITLDGQTAVVQTGQAIPYPTASSGFEYKNIGANLRVKPTIVPGRYDNRINLEFRSEFTELDDSRTWTIAGQEVPAIKLYSIETGAAVGDGKLCVFFGPPVRRLVVDKQKGLSDSGLEDHAVCREEEVEYVVVVRPEIMDQHTDSTARSALNADSADYQFNWEETRTGRVKPTSCDEGPVFTTCSAFKKCECSECDACGACGSYQLFNTKNAFPEPGSYNPFEASIIELPALHFELPELPSGPQSEQDLHAEAAPREFVPHMAKPMWLTRPVVAPVNYEEPVRE